MTGHVDFLRARYDEDERYLRAMKTAGERFRDEATPAQISRDTPVVRELFDAMLDDPEVVAALKAVQKTGDVPNDLDRLLRDVAAKRKILDLHVPVPGVQPPQCVICLEYEPCRTLAYQLAVYDGHPDYRPEWRTA